VMLESSGLRYQSRSDNLPIAHDTQVLLGDSMGEMFAYYAACDVAIIGGSLLLHGGQNLIEACSLGKPVIAGPHTYNCMDTTQWAIEAGAALRVQDAQNALVAAIDLLHDPQRMKRMGEAGIAFTRAHQGATLKALDLIKFRA